nr:hypothetical protein [Tanacetum cinerariifolium]
MYVLLLLSVLRTWKMTMLLRSWKVGASRRIESSDDMEDVFNQGKMIDDMDKDKGIELEVVKVMDTAKLITDVITTATSQVSAASKKDQIELDAEYAKKLHEEINKDHEEFNKDIDWDAKMDHVNQKSKNPQYIKRYQGLKKRPQTESEARKNMMIYLKNTAGYKMNFFKGMTYAEIYQEIIKSINETPAQKATKRRKLSEEAQEAKYLRKRLEVVDDEDDDCS